MKNRILRGIENFFFALRQAFINRNLQTCHILLAGNSCKSSLLQNIFETEMQTQQNIFAEEILKCTGRIADAVNFSLHMPPGRDENAQSYERIATGKSGVAFGLLDCRRGGNDILVIDKNFSVTEKFFYHLGTGDAQSNFKILIRRNENDGKWKKFLYVADESFDIYFTDEPRADGGKIPLYETSRITCRPNFTKNIRQGWAYIRKIAVNKIECVICQSENFSAENILSKVAIIEFSI